MKIYKRNKKEEIITV